MARLLKGDFERGLPGYEWRLGAQPNMVRPNAPLWDGSPLNGKTIRLQCEQGLGDSIQFIRYAAEVAGRGGRVVVACPRPLSRLFNGVAGVTGTIPHDAPAGSATACWAPLASLPHLCGTTLETIPNKSYLTPDAAWALIGESASLGKV
jgi:hypothetical protein